MKRYFWKKSELTNTYIFPNKAALLVRRRLKSFLLAKKFLEIDIFETKIKKKEKIINFTNVAIIREKLRFWAWLIKYLDDRTFGRCH